MAQSWTLAHIISTTSRQRVAVLWFGTADSSAAMIPTANKNPSNQITADRHIHRDVPADKGTNKKACRGTAVRVQLRT